MTPRPLCVLLLMSCLVQGCSRGDHPLDSPDMSPDLPDLPPIELQEATSALVTLQIEHACAQTWRCPEASYSDLPFLIRHPDQMACESAPHNILRDFLTSRYARLSRQVEAGHVKFDGVMANACLTAAREDFERTLCKSALLQDASCDAVFTGALSPGSSCVEHEECEPGTTCEETLSLISCTGQCTACGVEKCVGDTYCRREGGSSGCEPTLSVGEVCREGKACGDQRAFGCLKRDGEETGLCIELGTITRGEPCGEDTHCARGLTCRAGMCDDVKLSAALEPCSVIDVQTGLCEPGLVCAQPAPGEPTVCGPPRALGESCTSLLQCEDGLQCEESVPGDARTGTCQTLREDDERCELPFECVSKRCIVLAPTQGVCASEVVCE